MVSESNGLTTRGQFVNLLGGQLFVPEGHFAEAELLNGGTPEENVIKALQRLLKPGNVAIDIGANIGFVSLAMANAVGAGGKIFAVEADPEIAICTRATFAASAAANITLLQVAASDKIGLLHATLSSSSNTAFGHVSSGLEHHFRKTAVSFPLDDLIKDKIDLIKIDIEGAEYPALNGLRKTIAAHKPIVLSEFSVDYMKQSLGYDASEHLFKIFSKLRYSCRKVGSDGSLSSPLKYPDLVRVFEGEKAFGYGHIDIAFTPN